MSHPVCGRRVEKILTLDRVQNGLSDVVGEEFF